MSQKFSIYSTAYGYVNGLNILYKVGVPTDKVERYYGTEITSEMPLACEGRVTTRSKIIFPAAEM